MIGKIAPNGKGARGLASYLLRRGRGRIIAGTMAGLTPRELSQEFGALRRLNPNLTKAVAHLMLSPAPGDPPLTDTQWQAIAEHYAEAMGYAKTAWCGVVHNDTDHQHLHIIACRIDIHGKTISDANSYRKSESIVRRLERDFGLVAVASPTGIKRKSQSPIQSSPQPSPKTTTTSEESTTMTDSDIPSPPSPPPNPFDPSDSQHATWPEPFEPGRDVAELAIVATTPSIVMPSASPAERLTDSQRRDMRRALVEADYAQRMQTILGDDLTRVYKHAQGATLYFKQPGRIADQGDRLTVLGGMEEKLAAQRIVTLACDKRWETIRFTGSASFVERAMREALKQHLTVVASSQAQATILAKVMAERQGGMGSNAGPATGATAPVFPVDSILTILSELDEFPAQTLPRTAPPLAPVVPAFAPPPAPPATPPQPIPALVVGVLPRFLNLKERIKDRRESRTPAAPAPTPPTPLRKPWTP